MRAGATVALLLVLGALPGTAHAYRPFDGTDADVAAEGELELELGPIGYLKTGPQRFLVAPAAVLNIGVVHDWELVLAGRNLIGLDPPPGAPRLQLDDSGLFLKHVLREGSLQGKTGPSVAAEVGPLLPTSTEPAIGASAAVIVSQHWKPVTVHVNGQIAVTRSDHLDLFGGVIVEGPQAWTVRPVFEGYVERDFQTMLVFSGLVGAIWRAGEALSFDAAVRVAHISGGSEFELRAGLTWATPLWEPR
jgi:hypothetical protein